MKNKMILKMIDYNQK
jgi:hypothetical protein